MAKNTEEIERIVEMNEDLKANNDKLAATNLAKLKEHKIRSFDIVGAIGAGKTLLLEKLIEKISKKYRCYVICGDITLHLDADRIETRGARVQQVNTGRECALNAYHIHKVLSSIDLDSIDVLFIENVGNLICPSDFVLGVERRIVVVAITEGDHVIIKHPLLFKMSDVGIINKIDLEPVIQADIQRMLKDAQSINPNIKMFTTSAKTSEQIPELITYLGLD
jgi:hydrogenase nickel incorporation protein HypB